MKFKANLAGETPNDWAKSAHQDGGGNWIFWNECSPELAGITKIEYPNGEGFICPYGQPGDQLWVRETFQFVQANSDGQRRTFNSYEPFKIHDYQWIEYAATPRDEPAIKWKPSIFMPRWASRITLEITGVRVERLQEITEKDAIAEGCKQALEITPGSIPRGQVGHRTGYGLSYRRGYRELWDSINGKKHPWSSNPWVWVIEFKRLEPKERTK